MAVCLPRAAPAVLAVLGLVFAATGCVEMADHGVAVSSSANLDYAKAKYASGIPRPESYVFMAGHYFPGLTLDRSMDQLPFRRVAEMLAPELARQRYQPAKDFKSADLILVVHWGVTSPHETIDSMQANTTRGVDPLISFASAHTVSTDEQVISPGSDQAVADFFNLATSPEYMAVGFEDAVRRTDGLAADYDDANAIKLLGYGRHLRRESNQPVASTTEATLRSDLHGERYFVVLQAYDLRQISGKKPKLVWTLHLNMRSPGNNFREAVAMMSEVAVNYFGRDVDHVDTALPKQRVGVVTVGDIVIVGEPK